MGMAATRFGAALDEPGGDQRFEPLRQDV